ncbi:MAG: 4Fe-4S binding protein [Nitrospirae bacterium]|nr:4Fe-4S binding protein [Nitrospirota bacterium]
MKRIRAGLFAIVLCIAISGAAYGSEGHNAPAAMREFRIGAAKVKLELKPEVFINGNPSEAVVTLTDFMSGSPILDAGIYLLFEKAGPAGMPSGHIMAAPSSGAPAVDSGLDFGESPQMPAGIDLSAFKRLLPQQKAGVFAASYPLSKGEHTFTLAVKSLGGKKFAEPLIYGGTLSYAEASKALFYRMLFTISIIILSGLAGAWVIAQRKSATAKAGQKVNLLEIPWIKGFMKSAWFQPVFQVPVLVFFVIIIVAGLFDIQKGDRNIATILMWTIWWAAIIFTFVFVGRVWCMMCPFGAAQDWIGRLVSSGKDFPKPLRNIWLSSFIFFGLTWWDSFSGIVNKPALTAWLLIGFFTVAAGMAITFKGRSFCRYVCPIGGLIGLYSMFSPVELRNKCLEVCRDHKKKECIKGTEKSRPCPMFVTPMTLDRNNYCNFCSECIKSCSQGNITIRFRSFAKDLWVSTRGYMDEAYLALVIVGVSIVVTGEMVGPWHRWMDVVGKLIPFDALGLAAHAAREKTIFLLVMTAGSLIIPLLLLTFAALVVRKLTGPDSPLGLKNTAIQFAYMFIPVGLSMHLAHNISHLFKEGPGIIPAAQRVLNDYAGLKLGEPEWNAAPLMGPESIFWLQMLILIALNLFSLYAGYRIAARYYGDKALRAFIPMAALAVFFMIINTFILGQPMALRHTH